MAFVLPNFPAEDTLRSSLCIFYLWQRFSYADYCILQHVVCQTVCSVMDLEAIVEKNCVFLSSKSALTLLVVVTLFVLSAFFQFCETLTFYSCLLFLKTAWSLRVISRSWNRKTMYFMSQMDLRVLVLFCPFHLMSLYKCENSAVLSADFCAKQPQKCSPMTGCFAQPILFFAVGSDDYSAFSDSQGLPCCSLFSAVYSSWWSDIVVN